jgi:hypothetical protein
VPILMPDQLDTQASFDAIQKAGSLLGSAAIVVLDDTTCMVWLAENLLHFYRHESCGKCTPCREGPTGSTRSCAASSAAKGRCAISTCCRASRTTSPARRCAPSATRRSTPVLTTLKHFRHEYEAHIKEGRCTLPAEWRARQPVGPTMPRIEHERPGIVRASCFVAIHDAAAHRPVVLTLSSSPRCSLGGGDGVGGAPSGGAAAAAARPDPRRLAGLLQPFADVIKLMFKEELRPRAADPLLFALAPIISATAAFAAFAVVPFGARRRSSACSTSRCGCRWPTSTSRSW